VRFLTQTEPPRRDLTGLALGIAAAPKTPAVIPTRIGRTAARPSPRLGAVRRTCPGSPLHAHPRSPATVTAYDVCGNSATIGLAARLLVEQAGDSSTGAVAYPMTIDSHTATPTAMVMRTARARFVIFLSCSAPLATHAVQRSSEVRPCGRGATVSRAIPHGGPSARTELFTSAHTCESPRTSGACESRRCSRVNRRFASGSGIESSRRSSTNVRWCYCSCEVPGRGVWRPQHQRRME
jgi:hypothetical protein